MNSSREKCETMCVWNCEIMQREYDYEIVKSCFIKILVTFGSILNKEKWK
jgi:hypothetical protein